MRLDNNGRATVPCDLLGICTMKNDTDYYVYMDFEDVKLGFIEASEPIENKKIVGVIHTEKMLENGEIKKKRIRFSPGSVLMALCKDDDFKTFCKRWIFCVEDGKLYLKYLKLD